MRSARSNHFQRQFPSCAASATWTDRSPLFWALLLAALATLAVGFASPAGAQDVTPPEFSSIEANPSTAAEGMAVVISFTSSETLQENPSTAVNSHPATFVDLTGLNYTYLYSVQANDPTGPAEIAIEGLDLADNSGSTVTISALTIAGDPTGSVVINGDAAYSSSSIVNLSLPASSEFGIIGMRLSNNGVNWSPWVDYDDQTTWSLSPGQGLKTVYAQFADNVSRMTDATTDTIILDTIPPTGATIATSLHYVTEGDLISIFFSVLEDLPSSPTVMVNQRETVWFGLIGNIYRYVYIIQPDDEEGDTTITITGKDFAGNSVVYVNTQLLHIDMTPPTGSVSINSDAAFASDSTVTLGLTYSDTVTAVQNMRFRNESDAWSDWETVAATKAWNLTSGEGARTVSVEFEDLAGNVSTGLTSDSISVDLTVPTGSITVNSGNTFTNSLNATLQLAASDTGANPSGISRMRLRNAGDAWPAWQAFSVSQPWTLSAGDGNKTVEVQYEDMAGNLSIALSDSIDLDQTAPSGSIAINADSTWATSSDASLSLSATDGGSGVTQMRFFNLGESLSPWEAYDITKAWTLTAGEGERKVYVQYRDAMGNLSYFSDTIQVDQTAPSGSVAINAAADYTKTTAVTLALAGSDNNTITAMRLRNESDAWTAWEAYSTAKAWDLNAGDGAKTVSVEMRDAAGLVSTAAIQDSITLDQTAPTASLTINGGDAFTTGSTVTLNVNATDDGAGLALMRFFNLGEPLTAWEPFDANKTWALMAGDGERKVYAQVRDAAGNIDDASDTILSDQSAPSGTIVINDDALAINQINVSLALSATDSGPAGVASMRLRNEGGTWTTWQAFASTLGWVLPESEGLKTIQVEFRDAAGNVSTGTIADAITLDQTPPVATLLINDGAAIVRSRNVTLSIVASDEDSGETGIRIMRFLNVGGAWSPWQPYSETISWTLTSGDGEKKVYVLLKDQAGNASTSSIFDLIDLDTSLTSAQGAWVLYE
ncbi:hypothetical protein HQ520_07515 [bacterium]|nr:hypothetical protein [bacterium]